MLACSFFIESSSKLLVTRTGIKARTCLISGQIRLLTLELLALEWRKFYSFELEYLWSQLANLDQILCVASLGLRKGCIIFWGRLDQNSGVHGNKSLHWHTVGKIVSPPFLGCFIFGYFSYHQNILHWVLTIKLQEIIEYGTLMNCWISIKIWHFHQTWHNFTMFY